MNILILIGSHRRNGNTGQVCSLIQTHLEATAQRHSVPLNIETIHLGQRNIEFCRGCRICFDRGEDHCPIKDDIAMIRDKMRAADGLLIATPIYVDDVNGITKNWIDRMAYACHRPEFAGKIAFSVATVGSSRFSHAFDTLSLALGTWGFHIAGQAGFKTGALMKSGEAAQHDAKARQAAESFFRALHTQAYTRPSFKALLIFKIVQMAWANAKDDHDTIDYQYWKNKGWLDPQRKFFIPIQTLPIIVALARMTGRAISRFVS